MQGPIVNMFEESSITPERVRSRASLSPELLVWLCTIAARNTYEQDLEVLLLINFKILQYITCMVEVVDIFERFVAFRDRVNT